MSLEVLSQILAVVEIFASQEEFILTTFKKLSISPLLEKDLEVSLDSSFLSTKEIEKSCTKSNGEHPTKPEIKELSPCPINKPCMHYGDQLSKFSQHDRGGISEWSK